MEFLMWIGAIISALYLVVSIEIKDVKLESSEYVIFFSFDSLIPALLLAACAVGIFK